MYGTMTADEIQASRLFSLAITAIGGGDQQRANELAAMAGECLDRATSARPSQGPK